jgi:enoyl-[acyl-carrier protein] reductase I
MFTNKTFLITGIADENSLAMFVAKKSFKTEVRWFAPDLE